MAGKRTADVISPIGRDLNKNRRIMTDFSDSIDKLDQEIIAIAEKDDPSNRDLMQMMMLTSKRDTLRIQYVLVPEIVKAMLDSRLTEMFSEGGAARQAVIEEVGAATDETIRKVRGMEERIASLEEHRKSMKTPRKMEKIVRNERARCIEASSKGLVVFGVAVKDDESGGVDDERLGEIVREVVGPERAVAWKRMVKSRAVLHDWKGKGRPKISVRVESREARERIIKKAKEDKRFDVKREVPELLIEEFRELQREAARLREEEKCQTYVGCAGSDVFLRKRKDERQQWKTVKRL